MSLMSKGMCCSASQWICSSSSAGGHHRHGDLAHDDALAVDPDGHVALLDLRVAEDARERLGDGAGVHHVTVDDRLRAAERRVIPICDDLPSASFFPAEAP
jgi:hypothetical protein